MQKAVSRPYRVDLLTGHVWTDRPTADVILIAVGAGVLAAVTIAVVGGAISVDQGSLVLVSQHALALAGLIGLLNTLLVAALGLAFNGRGR